MGVPEYMRFPVEEFKQRCDLPPVIVPVLTSLP